MRYLKNNLLCIFKTVLKTKPFLKPILAAIKTLKEKLFKALDINK